MSLVEISLLKGINDTGISWDTIPFDFTTAQLRNDFLNQFGSYVRAFRVINRDVVNSLTYRQDSRDKTPIVLDPGSSDENEGWTSYIEINPNVVTGIGTLEVDIVPRDMAQKKLMSGQLGR